MTAEPLDADRWEAEAAADAALVLESEAPLWPQALSMSAATTAVAAAVAVAGVFMHCPCVILGAASELGWPAAADPL